MEKLSFSAIWKTEFFSFMKNLIFQLLEKTDCIWVGLAGHQADWLSINIWGLEGIVGGKAFTKHGPPTQRQRQGKAKTRQGKDKDENKDKTKTRMKAKTNISGQRCRGQEGLKSISCQSTRSILFHNLHFLNLYFDLFLEVKSPD